MKNLKPSQLPEGTVIDDDRHGEYIKRADGLWEETSCDYMGDRERVTDAGHSKEDVESYREFLTRTNLASADKSDYYFKNFKLIATAPGFNFSGRALDVHGSWGNEIGGFADGSRPHECRGYNCEY